MQCVIREFAAGRAGPGADFSPGPVTAAGQRLGGHATPTPANDVTYCS
jgi:hypothetical protein